MEPLKFPFFMAENKNKQDGAHFFSRKYSGYTDAERQTQKRFIIALVFVSFVALGFGGWYISYQLTNPFAPVVDKNSNTAISNAATQAVTLGGIDALREKDTDGDGLTDYDEFYIYNTSPYLVDSDGDGISDKDEIDAGTDPNCPTDKNCARTTLPSNTNIQTNSLLGDLQPDQTTSSGTGELTADELRQVLRNAGASEELLSQIPDEELLATYREIQADRGEISATQNTNSASQTNGGTANANFDTTNNEAVTYEVLQSLSPSEIRQFLIESGIPADTLSEIDDDTLLQVFQQSLGQYATQ